MSDEAAQYGVEEHLRSSEELFFKAFHVNPDPMVITRKADGLVIEANEAFARRCGVSRAEARGKTALELGIWKSQAERDELLAQLDASGSLRNREKTSILPNGQLRIGPVSIESLVIQGENCLLTISVDITEQRLAERALKESEERYRNFISLSAEGIVRLDFDQPIAVSRPVAEQYAAIVETGYVAECNEAFARTRGFRDAREVQGRRMIDFNQSSDPANRLNISQFIESGYSIVDGVTLGRDAFGKDRWFLNNAVGVVREGLLHHIWTVQRDITERVRAEQALEQVHAQALAASKDFAHRLISAQEQERKRLANELHDSLGQNLSLIKNHAYLALAQPGVAPETSAHLQAITEVVTGAIDEVRNLARNLRPLQIDQFGLTDALENLLDRVGQSGSLRIERRLENVDVFRGEEATHFFRIIQETLNNVLKHAEATRVLVALERDVHCVRLRVEDDGKGFDVAAVGRPTIRTGIGLSSVSERVQMLGGALEIHSAPNHGTNIRIEFPLSETTLPESGRRLEG